MLETRLVKLKSDVPIAVQISEKEEMPSGSTPEQLMCETFEGRKKFLAKTRRIEVAFLLFWNDQTYKRVYVRNSDLRQSQKEGDSVIPIMISLLEQERPHTFALICGNLSEELTREKAG